MQHTQTPCWPFPDKPPRNVQVEALKAAQGKHGFAFFMRMRLGKTLTAYAEFCNLRKSRDVDWMFVICPNTLKEQWRNAIEEVDFTELILVYESSNKAKIDKFFRGGKVQGGVVIINYESMRSFIEEGFFSKIDTLRTYVVADESTKIKDPGTRAAKACFEFAGMCPYKRVLSGKPRVNTNADMWSQLRFIGATQRNYFQHKYYFCVHGGWQGRQIVRDINTHILQKEMEPYCYIAPDHYINGFEKVYEPLRKVTLAARQLAQYKQMEKELILELGDDREITAPIALVKYLRLQQISSGIAGDPDGVQHNLVNPQHNPRISIVREILDNECSHKTIIACRFKLSVDNLLGILSGDGHKCSVLVGGMKPERIEEEKRKFNEGDNDVLIAQLQVLSYGHTLPGPDSNPCDSIIFYENDFSLSNRMQCESRPEKYERANLPISIYDMYASQMDKYILEKLRQKEDGAMALMGYARDKGLRPSMEEEPDMGVSKISKTNTTLEDLFSL